jgi:hypothetical protein
MKRIISMPALACVIGIIVAAPSGAQDLARTPAAAVPAASQDSAQTVRAAIPAQGARPATTQTPAQAPRPAESAPALADVQLDNIPNVRVDVTISYQVGQGPIVKRSASLLVAAGEYGSLRSGNQVAVPSTQFLPAASPKSESNTAATPMAPMGPMTSFNYRAVGLNVDARRVRVAGNRAKMDLNVEFSAVDEKAPDSGSRPPSFPTFSQSLSLVLENGKPVVIAQTSDVVDNVERKQSVEVKATILR